MKNNHNKYSPEQGCSFVQWAAPLALAAALMVGSGGQASAQEVLWDRIGKQSLDSRPISFDALGDIDGDGTGDFITGITTEGVVTIRSGADTSLMQRYFSSAMWGFATGFGGAVAGLGDFDGDGVPDYAMASPSHPVPGMGIGTGVVFVKSGATHDPIVRLPGLSPGEGHGKQVVGLGDVNGDGFADLGVATFVSSHAYRIYLGPSGALWREHSVISPPALFTLAPFGDHDGDGCDDYLIGIPGYSGLSHQAGRVELYSGRTGQLLLGMNGDRIKRLAGFSVSRGGDWNGDGVEDIVAGAPGTGILQSTDNSAGAYVFSGADGSILHFFDGEAYCGQNSAFGWSVSSGKDVSGDGVPDLIVGAPLEPWNSLPGIGVRGSAFVFSGATKALLWEHTGSVGGEKAGFRVRMVDDHNADGLDDWMVLAPEFDLSPENIDTGDEGRLTLFAGAPGDVTAACSGAPNSTGVPALLTTSGSIGVEENQFGLLLSAMPESHLALVLHAQGLAAPTPFGAGELCLQAPTSVLAVVTTSSSASSTSPGQALLPLDLSTPPFSTTTGRLQPASTWAFQAIYREGGVRNTSNALEIVFLP